LGHSGSKSKEFDPVRVDSDLERVGSDEERACSDQVRAGSCSVRASSDSVPPHTDRGYWGIDSVRGCTGFGRTARWSGRLSLLQRCENGVERQARSEGGGGLGVVRLVVTAEVDGLALDGEEFGDDLAFVEGERVSDWREEFL